MTLIPPKKLPVDKASKIEIGPIARGLGKLSVQPLRVGIIAVVLLIPMFIGFQQLEVGFEQRDQFDQNIEVVADFIMLSDEFQSSRSPLYVVYDGDVISPNGRESWNMTMAAISASPDITGVPNGLWDLIQESRVQYQNLDQIMVDIDIGEVDAWNDLADWLLLNETGRQISSALLHSNGQQTLISFQATTLDWQATVDLNDRIEQILDEVEQEIPDDGKLRVSGRSLINAQTTSDVAASSIQSTALVAIVILVMLVSIHSYRQRFNSGTLQRCSLMDSANDGCLLGVWNHGIHRLQYQSTNSHYRSTIFGTWRRLCGHFTTRLEEEVEHNPRATQQEWVEGLSNNRQGYVWSGIDNRRWICLLNLSALLPLRLFGQAFVVAITLALLSSLILLPAFYTKFLAKDAQRYIEEE